MRITIDIDESVLESVKKATKQRKMSPAVAMALQDYLMMKKREAFVAMVMEGRTDYAADNDEVESMSEFDKP